MVNELVIKGIDKLVGTEIFGRKITKLEIKERFGAGSKCYSFTIDGRKYEPSSDRNVSPDRDWTSEFEVVLSKFPKNGIYELFVMGWHGVTCVNILKEELVNKDVFISYFEDALYKLKKYYEIELGRK
jgi:hypothetical protein